MSGLKKIIDSFYLKDELNPDIWELPNEKRMGDKDGQEYKLKPEVQKKMMEIAELFIDYLDVDEFVQDIIFVGSLAGYNWSEYSDVDIHIVYDFDDFGKQKDLYTEFFDLKKNLFNTSHDIIIKGFDVELYVENEETGNESMGEYSLLKKKWNKVPKQTSFKLNEKKLESKVKQWMSIIDGAIENAKDENLKDAIKIIDKYKNKIRKYRVCGLEKGGEFSYENLVFKTLRRNGYISKLMEFKNQIIDKNLSLEQENSE